MVQIPRRPLGASTQAVPHCSRKRRTGPDERGRAPCRQLQFPGISLTERVLVVVVTACGRSSACVLCSTSSRLYFTTRPKAGCAQPSSCCYLCSGILQRHFAATFCSSVLLPLCFFACQSAAALVLRHITWLPFFFFTVSFCFILRVTICSLQGGETNFMYLLAAAFLYGLVTLCDVSLFFTVFHHFVTLCITCVIFPSLFPSFCDFFHHFVPFSIILSLYGLVTLTHKSYISSRNTIKCEFAPVLPNFHSGSVGKLG